MRSSSTSKSQRDSGRVYTGGYISTPTQRTSHARLRSTARTEEMVTRSLVRTTGKTIAKKRVAIAAPKKKNRKISYKKLAMMIVLVSIVTFSSFGGYDVIKNKMASFTSQDAKNGSNNIREKVSRLIKTEDLNVKVYKISDPQPLKLKSGFYKDALQGDYVLVYQDSQKVLLYRESEDVIVNYSTVDKM